MHIPVGPVVVPVVVPVVGPVSCSSCKSYHVVLVGPVIPAVPVVLAAVPVGPATRE